MVTEVFFCVDDHCGVRVEEKAVRGASFSPHNVSQASQLKTGIRTLTPLQTVSPSVSPSVKGSVILPDVQALKPDRGA